MTENSPTPSLPPAKPLQGFPETAAEDARLALIRAYQAHALRQPDPLAANLAVINGDLWSWCIDFGSVLDEAERFKRPFRSWHTKSRFYWHGAHR